MTSHDPGCKLTDLEAALLLTATDTGAIKIPNGTAMEIDECRDLLAGLQRKGLVRHAKDAPYYSPFHLTEAGKARKLEVLGSRKKEKKEKKSDQ